MVLTKRKTNISVQTKNMSTVEVVIILLFTAYYLLPIVSDLIPFTVATLLGVLYVFYLHQRNPYDGAYALKTVLVIAWIALMYFLLTDTVTISEAVSNAALKQYFSKFYQQLMMVFPAFLTFRVAKAANYKQKKWLLGIISGMILYVIFITMRALAINPGITRNWLNTSELSGTNIAHYSFVYAIPILIGVLMLTFMHVKRISLKILCVGLIALFFLFLLQAQYTLAFLISIIGVLIAFLKSTRNAAVALLSILATISIFAFLPNLLNFAASNIESDQMSLRLEELASFFSSGDASGYNLNSRLTLYWETIKAFFMSPIWGNRSLGFDGHATFLTVLSDTGILGGIPFYLLYFSMRKHITYFIEDERKHFSIPFIMLLIMGFTNPIHAAFPVGFATWFIAPLVIMLFTNKPSKEDSQNEQLES